MTNDNKNNDGNGNDKDVAKTAARERAEVGRARRGSRSAALRFHEVRRYRLDEPWPAREDVAQEEWPERDQVGDLGNAEDEVQFAPEDYGDSDHSVGAPTPWAVARHKEAEAWNRLETLMRMRANEEWTPTSQDDWEWKEVWDQMVRAEAESRSKRWEPDRDDPAAPESSPEIADWQRHWPDDEAGSDQALNEAKAPKDDEPGPSSPMVMAMTVVKKWIWRRKF